MHDGSFSDSQLAHETTCFESSAGPQVHSKYSTWSSLSARMPSSSMSLYCCGVSASPIFSGSFLRSQHPTA
jgi:hypothetical protein